MKRKSEKHSAELAKYSALRKSFLTRNRGCQAIKYSGAKCTNLATQVHHRKGRGKYLNVVGTWMAVCPRCHENIEKARAWSKAMGYIINRMAPFAVPPLHQKEK